MLKIGISASFLHPEREPRAFFPGMTLQYHPPGDSTFFDDTPLLDDFLAHAAHDKAAACTP